ncbi:hypothetical protein TNCV_1094171 [Trichonephila clavipes]|uniref:Uncharacterized protein n=1 Tax=Trichonephila clavipes TaxID=2585209 RepID=A0A8X6RQS1_TRICX|nr:hypothetical protein TNCV_1094171 [Trichonephila clavipes]
MQECDPVDDDKVEGEDNNNESCNGSSNANAFSGLETAVEGYEQHSECCPTQLMLLKRISDPVAKNQRSTMRSFSNESHLIATFMKMNKPTSWSKSLRHCIHLAFRWLFETPSDFSGTNCDRREFPLLQTRLLANIGLVCSMAKDVLSFLPYMACGMFQNRHRT